MDIVKQIKSLCDRNGQEWFYSHTAPEIGLNDFLLQEQEIELFGANGCTMYDFENRKCTCNPPFEKIICSCDGSNCLNKCCHSCAVEKKRLEMSTGISKDFRDYSLGELKRSRWILHKNRKRVVDGFIFITKESNYDDEYDYYIYFALVDKKLRKKGILKRMLTQIPKHWNLKLDVSGDMRDRNNSMIWQKCGFKYSREESYGSYSRHIKKAEVILPKTDEGADEKLKRLLAENNLLETIEKVHERDIFDDFKVKVDLQRKATRLKCKTDDFNHIDCTCRVEKIQCTCNGKDCIYGDYCTHCWIRGQKRYLYEKDKGEDEEYSFSCLDYIWSAEFDDKNDLIGVILLDEIVKDFYTNEYGFLLIKQGYDKTEILKKLLDKLPKNRKFDINIQKDKPDWEEYFNAWMNYGFTKQKIDYDEDEPEEEHEKYNVWIEYTP